MQKDTVEILVADRTLETAASASIGPRRRMTLARWGRPAADSVPAAGCVGLALARGLPALARFEPACTSRWGGCIVFVEPNTPPEVLSWGLRLVPERRSALQFVTVHDRHDVVPMARAVIERLYRGLESERILHAWWSGASLHVVTTRFARWSISYRSLCSLGGMRRAQLRDVEVTYDGASIVLPRAQRTFEASALLELAARPGNGAKSLGR